MKRIEIGLVVFAILSISLRIGQVVGSSFLTMVSFLIMSCFYYGFSFALFNGIKFREILRRQSYQNVTAIHIITSIIAGMGIATLLIGILYRILNFNGASELIVSGIITLSIAIVITIWRFIKERHVVYKRIWQRTALVLGLGLLSLLI